MVEADTYCIDVIRQIQAIDATLNKVSTRIFRSLEFVCNHGHRGK